MRVRSEETNQGRQVPLWLAGTMALALAQAASAAPLPQDAPARDYDAQDARLNTVYKQLSQSLDDTGRKALRDEERQWIAGRDRACGVAAGTTVKNTCTTTQTSFRADELQKRLAHGGKASAAAAGGSIAGDWGYRSKCNFGHAAQLGITTSSATAAEGTWADGTDNGGNQGQFKGAWRDGKLYLRFCAETEERGGYPVCPAMGDESAYVVPVGNRLAWYRAEGSPGEGNYEKYVTLDRVPKGGRAPLDTQCKDAP